MGSERGGYLEGELFVRRLQADSAAFGAAFLTSTT